MDYREELMVKMLASFDNDYGIDTQDARNKLVFILNDYKVEKVCTDLVVTDIHEKMQLFLTVKKLEGLTDGSIENYRNTIFDFSRYIYKPVAQVETMDIRKYLAVYYNKVKPVTINSKRSKLNGFFEWLYNEGYIEKNPARNVAPIKTESRERKGLTLEQLELLREKCGSTREKALIEFLYATGCRVSEVVGLKVSDLDFNEMSLYVIGKGNKERKVYFNERAKVVLKAYLARRDGDSTALFASYREPYCPLGREAIAKEIKEVGQRMNPPLNIFPHLLRHTFASHAINAGIELGSVQRFLGHSSPATTVIYAKLNDTKLREDYRKF